MRYVSQYRGRAPAADYDVFLSGQLEDFLGRLAGQLLLVDFPALEERCLAFEIAMHRALFHAEALRDVVLDKFLVNNRKAHLIRKPCRDVLTERPHLSC